MTLHPIPLNFLIYGENFIFFFISARMSENIYFNFKEKNEYRFALWRYIGVFEISAKFKKKKNLNRKNLKKLYELF
jgi:hypothetical protein